MRPTTPGIRKIRHATTALVGSLLLLPAAAASEGTPAPATAVQVEEVGRALSSWRRGTAGVMVADSGIAERISVLRTESASFDRAWLELERSGIPVLVGTHAQVQEVLPRHLRSGAGWAGVTVLFGDGDGRLRRALVVLRTEWLRETHTVHGTGEQSFLQAFEELIVHEVYGHLVPAVEAREVHAICADPLPEQPHFDSCVGRRELAIRTEREGALLAAVAAERDDGPGRGVRLGSP